MDYLQRATLLIRGPIWLFPPGKPISMAYVDSGNGLRTFTRIENSWLGAHNISGCEKDVIPKNSLKHPGSSAGRGAVQARRRRKAHPHLNGFTFSLARSPQGELKNFTGTAATHCFSGDYKSRCRIPDFSRLRSQARLFSQARSKQNGGGAMKAGVFFADRWFRSQLESASVVSGEMNAGGVFSTMKACR